ncbi:hypothetical protein [Mesomycoplasma conjunctivae]|uniref:hypothetical protein n=1 Tax=Mesomycoplasma conjunctivae TaxID=45361 RepID=UPI003DA256AB
MGIWEQFITNSLTHKHFVHSVLLVSRYREVIDEKIKFLLEKFDNKAKIITFNIQLDKTSRTDFLEEINQLYFSNVGASNLRFVIIKSVDQGHPSLLNSLLKIIEEPPQDTYFIFSAQKKEKVLSTICSRSQIFYFSNYEFRKILFQILEKKQKNEYNWLFAQIFSNEQQIEEFINLCTPTILEHFEEILSEFSTNYNNFILELNSLLEKENAFFLLKVLQYFFNAFIGVSYPQLPNNIKIAIKKTKKHIFDRQLSVIINDHIQNLLNSLETYQNFNLQKQAFLVKIYEVFSKFYD